MINNPRLAVISTVFGTPTDLGHIFCQTSVNIYCGDLVLLFAVIVNLPSLCLLTDESDLWPGGARRRGRGWHLYVVCGVCAHTCEWWPKNFLLEPQCQLHSPLRHCAIRSFKNLNPLMPTKHTKPHIYTCTHTQDITTLWPATNRRDERTLRAQEKDMRVGYGWDEGMLKLSGDSQGLPQFVVIYFHRRHLMFDWLSA